MVRYGGGTTSETVSQRESGHARKRDLGCSRDDFERAQVGMLDLRVVLSRYRAVVVALMGSL